MKKIYLMTLAVMTSGLFLTGCLSTPIKPIPNINGTNAEKYQEYTPARMEALKGKQPFMLFFYAEWCSTCKAWQARTIQNIADLPVTTRILRVDYDNSAELKKEYGVNTQSIGVFFDASGNKVKNSIDPQMSEVVEFFQTNKAITANPIEEVVPAVKIGEVNTENEVIEEVTQEVKAVTTNDEPKIEGVDLAYYTDYSKEKFDTIKGKQKFIVFFYSDWCGTCRAWEAKVKAAGSTLPKNTIILKARYDDDKDLVKSWGVKTQSTGVFFNANGDIDKLVIDPSLDALTTFFSN